MSFAEKLKIDISRVFLKTPKIVIANLVTKDKSLTQYSERIVRALENLKKKNGKLLTIILSNRVDFLDNVDKFIVLEKG